MSRGGKRRNYTRDANGRFASTPGGGSKSLAAARKAARPTSGRKGTLSARTSLKKSRAKLAARDPADQRLSSTLSSRAQKAAVTRGNRKLAAAKGAAKTTLQGTATTGTIRRNRAKPITAIAKPARIANRSVADQAHRDKLAKQAKTLEKPLRRAMASIGMGFMGPLPGGRKPVQQLRPLTGRLRVKTLNERIRMDPYDSTHLRQYAGEMVSDLLGTPSKGKNKLKPQERTSIVSSTINAIRKLNARAAINYSTKLRRKVRMQGPASTLAKPSGLKPGALAKTPPIKKMRENNKKTRSFAKPDLSQSAFERRAKVTENRAKAAERSLAALDRYNPQNRKLLNRTNVLRGAADSYASYAKRGKLNSGVSAADLFHGRYRSTTAPKLTRSEKAAATRRENAEKRFYENIRKMEQSRRR